MTMELNKFISSSIIEIITGIKNAQNHLKIEGAIIVPDTTYRKAMDGDLQERNTKEPVFHIEYDLAVTTVEGSQTNRGIGVLSSLISLGAQGQTEKTNESVSRLKFEIPVIYPIHNPK